MTYDPKLPDDIFTCDNCGKTMRHHGRLAECYPSYEERLDTGWTPRRNAFGFLGWSRGREWEPMTEREGAAYWQRQEAAHIASSPEVGS